MARRRVRDRDGTQIHPLPPTVASLGLPCLPSEAPLRASCSVFSFWNVLSSLLARLANSSEPSRAIRVPCLALPQRA